MHDAEWWEYKLISMAICFVIAVGCHVLYTILTNGRPLEDDARWYAQQRKQEAARKKSGGTGQYVRLGPGTPGTS